MVPDEKLQTDLLSNKAFVMFVMYVVAFDQVKKIYAPVVKDAHVDGFSIQDDLQRQFIDGFDAASFQKAEAA
ncbi:hypothetical protein ABK046_47930, partial [Streptomyces caeruleatus]